MNERREIILLIKRVARIEEALAKAYQLHACDQSENCAICVIFTETRADAIDKTKSRRSASA